MFSSLHNGNRNKRAEINIQKNWKQKVSEESEKKLLKQGLKALDIQIERIGLSWKGEAHQKRYFELAKF